MTFRQQSLLALLLAAAVGAGAQEPPAGPPAPKPDPARRSALMVDDMGGELRAEAPAIKEHMNRIDAELKLLDRAAMKGTDWAKEWAGTYYEGDGLGENASIHLAPKSGIAFLNYGCLGLYGGDHGEVVETLPDGLRLKLAFGDRRNSFLSERVYFVRWGGEHFLVPEWLMPEMVNNYNRGGSARSSMYGIPRLVREDAPHRTFITPKGRPELPQRFARLLLTKPVELKVSKVSPPATRRVTGNVQGSSCTIDFEGGSDKGIYVGMKFRYPKGVVLASGEIRITSVTPTTSTGAFAAFFGDGEKPNVPAVGETVSTSDDDSVSTEPADDAIKPEAPKAPPK